MDVFKSIEEFAGTNMGAILPLALGYGEEVLPAANAKKPEIVGCLLPT